MRLTALDQLAQPDFEITGLAGLSDCLAQIGGQGWADL